MKKNLLEFAQSELDILGLKEDGTEVDVAMRKHLLHMIEEFAKEGHTPQSALYAIACLTKLLKYEILTPLTGEMLEWEPSHFEGEELICVNTRSNRVFRKNGPQDAYDAEGKVFWEWKTTEDGRLYKDFYTTEESKTPITFPYTPTTEYIEKAREE